MHILIYSLVRCQFSLFHLTMNAVSRGILKRDRIEQVRGSGPTDSNKCVAAALQTRTSAWQRPSPLFVTCEAARSARLR